MEYNLLKGTTAQKLNDHNYLAWSRWVKSILVARGHWKVVQGVYVKLEVMAVEGIDTQVSIDNLEKWESVNQKAWADIYSSCTPADSTHYADETVKELWDCLENTKKLKGKMYYRSQL